MSNRCHIHCFCQLCNSPSLKLGHCAAAAARCCIDAEVQRLTDFTVGDVATVRKKPKQDLAMFLLLVLTSPAIPELMFQGFPQGPSKGPKRCPANSIGCFHNVEEQHNKVQRTHCHIQLMVEHRERVCCLLNSRVCSSPCSELCVQKEVCTKYVLWLVYRPLVLCSCCCWSMT